MQLFKKEPAVLLGLLASVLTGIAELFVNDPNLTWTSAMPLIVGVVIRQFVYAPATVEGADRPGT